VISGPGCGTPETHFRQHCEALFRAFKLINEITPMFKGTRRNRSGTLWSSAALRFCPVVKRRKGVSSKRRMVF